MLRLFIVWAIGRMLLTEVLTRRFPILILLLLHHLQGGLHTRLVRLEELLLLLEPLELAFGLRSPHFGASLLGISC